MSRTMPAEYVDAFMSFFADGTLDESTVLPTVQEVTGRPARTFEQGQHVRMIDVSHRVTIARVDVNLEVFHHRLVACVAIATKVNAGRA